MKDRSILELFEVLLEKSNFSDKRFLEINAEEIKHLKSRLDMTEVQVQALAFFLSKMFDCVTFEKISKELGWSPVQLLKNENQILELVKRNYLVRERNPRQMEVFSMTHAAREALRDDHPLENVLKKNNELFDKMQLVERFEVIGEYLNSRNKNRFDSSIVAVEDLPDMIQKQVNAVQAELEWSVNEIIVFSKILKFTGRCHDTLFDSYNEKIFYRMAIKALLDKRLIMSRAQFEDSYSVMPLILKNLVAGKKLEFPLKFAHNDDLFNGFRLQFSMRRGDNKAFFNSGRIFSEMAADIMQILENNLHLTFCRQLSGLMLDENEKITLIYLSHRLINHCDQSVHTESLEKIRCNETR